ncbi:MAG: NUDIX hydrolase [Humidesulfovibrio sp.]|uniref:NUDIX domain-containing protein n=1 Tax=Humidesulfovibrio sp. TaxID=2910988 RepID=UPI0027362471|nr:NUDIX hydrolase [Humidesulfovibrio sp.]MDP2849309.1 NUDIX hydrolase [Humidesulfovibrio sp.]
MEELRLQEILASVRASIDNPNAGLPEDVFLFISALTPLVNVDLLIRDRNGRVLLAWRDDPYYECGWHVPGGILRYQESLEERLQKTAEHELGCRVDVEQPRLDVVELIHPGQKHRGHFLTFIYACRLPDHWDIQQQPQSPGEPGHLEWHNTFPKNMIPVHSFYSKYFS